MFRRKLLLSVVLLLMLGFLAGIFYYTLQEHSREQGRRSTLVWSGEVRG